ncbi:hypothetical protein B0T09DRAFT_351816 [Sordaria sp. MPI-SDFR-AT-0083]|nr:hypothetical protein B0T09DRAFT_351816 [Sordaria sp. MPI-SDFR-AT-0083]
MNPSRVSRPRRSAQKGAATKALAVLIESAGEPSEMPCSSCHRHGRTCVVDPLKSNSCSECVRRKTSCDGQDVTRRLYQSMKDAKRLEEEEDKLLRRSVEIQSRLLRVREQKRHLQKRQKEMFDRGMADLAEELGDNNPLGVGNPLGEPANSSDDPVPVDLTGEGLDFDQWARENGLEMPEFGAAVVAGQDSGDANPQSLS